MNNKGFTLIEILVAIAILAIASGFVATRFFGLINNQNDFENEVLAKSIAEAAYIFYDSEENKNVDGRLINQDCQSIGKLIENGFLLEDQGLLKKYESSELDNYRYKVEKTDGEKTVIVYKGGSCDDSNKLYEYLGD